MVEKIHHRHQGGDWERSDDPTERLDLPGEGAFNRLFGGVNRFDRSNNPAKAHHITLPSPPLPASL